MKRTMKSGLFWATAIVMSIGLSFSVMADDLRISTGASGGTYHNVFGVNLADIMREQGFQPETLTSKGSAENLDRIVNGEADVGFTQADALALWLTKHPGAGVEILGKLGQECVYLAVSDNGDVQDESDLDNAGASIAVGDQGSGSAMTWDYLRTLNEDYQSASTYYQGGIRALAKVKTGELDAFLGHVAREPEPQVPPGGAHQRLRHAPGRCRRLRAQQQASEWRAGLRVPRRGARRRHVRRYRRSALPLSAGRRQSRSR